jgi:alkaline phosphatase
MILKKLALLAFTFTLIPTVLADQTVKSPKYVFMIIGDGMGLAQRELGKLYKRKITRDNSAQLLMNTFPVTGLNMTHSANNLVTDSAAAGTALATGYKANNKAVAYLPDGAKPISLITAAQKRGWATGVITTDEITNATPGSFMAHNKSRKNMDEIAEDVAISNVDFIAGGGYGYFIPKNSRLESMRDDKEDLILQMKQKGYRSFIGENSVNEFVKWTPNDSEKVVALFTAENMPFELDKTFTASNLPSISDMTAKAISVLEKHKKPFFLVIENEGTDTSAHRHDAHALMQEVLELDNATKSAYEFYKKHPEETLIIVTADHETGGLGLGHPKKYFLDLTAALNTKVSTEHSFAGFRSTELGAVKAFASEYFGLTELTEKEEKLLLKAIKKEIKKPSKKSHTGKRPIALAINNIVSARSGINWTSVKHTASPVVLTAIGVGSEQFSGYLDNTEVSKTLSKILNF